MMSNYSGWIKFFYTIFNKLNNLKMRICVKFNIIKIPMPPPIYINKIRTPASYLNFFITNRSVLLPVFKVKGERKVINLFKKNFKNKKIVPIDCKELIWGFGAIHCMTQQEPKL